MSGGEAGGGSPRYGEHQPNPDYQYEPPERGYVDGQPVVWIDAGIVPYARDIAEHGAKLKFPKTPR